MPIRLIQCSPSTAPSGFTSMLTPAFVPQYAICDGEPTCADSELVQQMAPPWPSLTICFAPSVQTSHVRRKFVSETVSKSSTDVLSHVMNGLMPAFDTT